MARALDDVSVSLVGLAKGVQPTQAADIYAASHAPYALSLIAIFLGGLISGFLVPKKPILASTATALPIFCIYMNQWLVAYKSGTIISEMLPGTLIVVAVLPLAVLAGYVAQVNYKEDQDVDLKNDTITIFGVKWVHVFWMPVMAISFIPSLVYTVVAYLMQAWGLAHFTIHPSLWFSLNWYIGLFFVGAIFFALSAYLSFYAFYKFWSLLQYRQRTITGWHLWLRLFWFGGLAPSASFFMSASYFELIWKLLKT